MLKYSTQFYNLEETVLGNLVDFHLPYEMVIHQK